MTTKARRASHYYPELGKDHMEAVCVYLVKEGYRAESRGPHIFTDAPEGKIQVAVIRTSAA